MSSSSSGPLRVALRLKTFRCKYLVPLPNLLIDDVQVDFQMEVTATETLTQKSDETASLDANAKFKFGCFGSGSVNVSGKVSSSHENTRSTNQTAKYQVYVSARQQR